MKPTTGLFITIAVISLHFMDAFITPSDTEPECPGITCPLNETIDRETCLCICQANSTWQEGDMQSNSDWPRGQYALPASIYGCPEPDWTRRFIEITLQNNDIYWESKLSRKSGNVLKMNQELHILGPFSDRSIQLNVCVKEHTQTFKEWPKENYCIFKTEHQCPPGFNSGNLVLTKNNSSITVGGFPTRIVGSKDVEVSFCCKNDDKDRQSATMPDDSPFVLFKKSLSRKCPPYSEAVYEETVYLPNYIFNMELSDMLSDLNTTGSHVGLTFCSYHVSSEPELYCHNNRTTVSLDYLCDNEDDCGDHSDELYCDFAEISYEFICNNNESTVQLEYLCDNDDDCGDNSDELHCKSKTRFRCNNNESTVLLEFLCDNEDDCGDNSDELYCRIGRPKFRCHSSGITVPLDYLCDSIHDCDDNSDEQYCRVGGEFGFRCHNNKRTVLLKYLCDNKDDCDDSSDELYCKSMSDERPTYRGGYISYNKDLAMPDAGETVRVYVSRQQWDFMNGGAVACSLSSSGVCPYPIVGQYVTAVSKTYNITEVKVYGLETGCGHFLGMISGNIKDFQVETSSNWDDIIHIRALNGSKGWCSSRNDIQPWIKIDLIVPMRVQGVVLQGWSKIEQYYNQTQFLIEYGTKNNLSLYCDESENPKIFIINPENVRGLQKFLFRKELVARIIKIRFLNVTVFKTCAKIELIGCPVLYIRKSHCNNKGEIDFGYSSTRHMIIKNKKLRCENNITSLSKCHNVTWSLGFHGNVFDDERKECCFFNNSIVNQRWGGKMTKNLARDVIVSERICLANIFDLVTISQKRGIISSPLFPNNYPEEVKKTIKIDAKKQFVKLTILFVSLARTATHKYTRKVAKTFRYNAPNGFRNKRINPINHKDTLSIDIGGEKPIEITSDNQDMYRHVTFISTTHTVYITFNTYTQYRVTMDKRYMIQYEPVDYPGCGLDYSSVNVQCTTRKAFIASHLYSSLFRKATKNVWRLTAKPNQYIRLYFIDIDLSVSDFLEIFDVDSTTEELLWSWEKGTHALQFVESSWHILKIIHENGSKLKRRGFLGQYEFVELQFSKDSSSFGCPSGMYRFQQNCYLLEVEKNLINQQHAEHSCRKIGGHLVSIDSKQEMEFIFDLCKRNSTHNIRGRSVLIGLFKDADDVYYRWSDSQPLVYTAWYVGPVKKSLQTDGGYYKNCTALVFSDGHNIHNWHAVPCDNFTGMFVCEIQIDIPKKEAFLSSWNLMEGSYNLTTDNARFFTCGTGEYVIKLAVCDTLFQCVDKSDEMQCESSKCSNATFKCDDGVCIPWAYYCDHVEQCADGSDEIGCSWPNCSGSEWRCNNKQCIPKFQKCDSVKHCFDGSDETNCVSTTRSSKEIWSKKQTCEDWWKSGARRNGTYVLYTDKVAIEVFCTFKVSGRFVVIITSIDEPATALTRNESVYTHFIKPKTVEWKSQLNKKESLTYTCSQKVELSCFNRNIVNNDQLSNICKNRECKCLEVNWEELDAVFPLTDSIIVYDPDILPILETNMPTNNISFDDESFAYISSGPVLCSTELPLTSVYTNIGELDKSRLARKRCIYESESKLFIDMSHLHYCDDFVCPSGYFKCAQGFCLSSDLVCDGQNHCSDGKDEEHCESMHCPGLFRCRNSKKCLTIEKVCDGIIDCPMIDDELGCNMACPDDCTCNAGVIVCHYSSVQDVYGTLNSSNVRKLDISYSFFNQIFSVPDTPFLGDLICIDCGIESLPSLSFEQLRNLYFLNLSYNRLKTIVNGIFHGLTRLRCLNLAGNFLTTIEENSFVGLSSLRELNVSSNEIHTVDDRAFIPSKSLISLNLMHNRITIFSAKIFSPLRKLEELSSDLFHFCCNSIKPETVSDNHCRISQQEEDFSSCKDLIKNTILRKSIWIVGLCSLFGNIGVMLYRRTQQRHQPYKTHELFVLNLSISDMLMGIYLLVIAVADAIFKGDYVSNDIYWRKSPYCKMAGVLSTISSEASVTFILFMTVDCFFKVRYPFSTRYHITTRRAITSSVVSWAVVAFLAVLPIIYKTYFANMFYSQTSVCLALPLSRRKTEGWEYSVAIFVVYNSVAFLVIAFLQINIYNAGKSSNRVIKTNTKQDFVLARRITMILVTDFLCWVPIGIMGIMSVHGHAFSPDVYAWVAVFVLPINSALNPFLYTFSEVLHQNLIKIKETVETFVYQYFMRNRRKKYRWFKMTTVPSARQGWRKRKWALKMRSLNDVLKWKKLKPNEAYVLLCNIVQRVVYLHQHGYTFEDTIIPEHVTVYLDKKTLVHAEIDLGIKKLDCKGDSHKSIGEIGLLTRTILRKTEQ